MISAVIKYSDDTISVTRKEVVGVGTKFESGFYEARTNDNGEIIITQKKIHELHEPFDSTENDLVIKAVESFFTDGVKDKINTLGYIHKLGILLYGEPGTGKTSLMTYLANILVESFGGIVFYCNDGNTLGTSIGLASNIREIQAEPIIFISDEFERYAEHSESEMKNLLDGKDSIENSLFLGATNYLNKVPSTMTERPSRFRLVVEIKGITDKEKMYKITESISNKIKPSLFTKDEIIEIFENKTSTTIDEIKNICLTKATDSIILNESITNKIGFKPISSNKEDEEGLKEIKARWATQSYLIGGENSDVGSVKERVKKQLD